MENGIESRRAGILYNRWEEPGLGSGTGREVQVVGETYLTLVSTGASSPLHRDLPLAVRIFMEDHEFLVAPVCQVVPFEVKQRYVTEINGIEMETYINWMKSCYYVTVTALPAISVPCGFTPEGLPVGIQIVGRHRDDLGVLQLAHAFELATGFRKHRPPISV